MECYLRIQYVRVSAYAGLITDLSDMVIFLCLGYGNLGGRNSLFRFPQRVVAVPHIQFYVIGILPIGFLGSHKIRLGSSYFGFCHTAVKHIHFKTYAYTPVASLSTGPSVVRPAVGKGTGNRRHPSGFSRVQRRLCRFYLQTALLQVQPMEHRMVDTVGEHFFILLISQFFHRIQFGILVNSYHIVQSGFRNAVAVFRFDQILLGRGQFHLTAEQVHLGHYAHIILGLHIFQMVL